MFFGLGIAAWFVLPGQWQWLALLAGCLGGAVAALAAMRENGRFPYLRQALAACLLALAAGMAIVWIKSAAVGTPGIARPVVAVITGRVEVRDEDPAQQRVRITLATWEPGTGRPIRVRLNVAQTQDRAAAREGAELRVKARLVPPAPPMLPGGYDFARTAWFQGLAATGSALSPIEVLHPGKAEEGGLPRVQRQISEHVRQRIAGSAGGIAAAFASGDRGGIALADEEAMRDAGLTHLLSISGLHVSAVVAAVYVLCARLLALWPWLALRFRLPLVSAAAGALAGIGYTLLTGAEVPTVRSCIGALLVLAAMALGREPLSLRMLAVAGFLVMLIWPEAVVGPSFQMSFASVIAIVALHAAEPVRRFAFPRDEGWAMRALRHLALLLLTGIVIELALMPIGLFHFRRAGVYGAFANVIAIPLTTFVTMPFVALGLLLDAVGAGGPAWWIAGKSLDGLLALAHWVASRPGAVTFLPPMGAGGYALFLAGGLWLALWRGRARLWGLVPVAVGTLLLATLRPPDVFISGDGRHVGFTGLADGELVVLREARSDYVRENLSELSGMEGAQRPLASWPGARCSPDFCIIELARGQRRWSLMLSRGEDVVPLRALAAACERVDIVIADRRLPWSCHPRLLKADRALLDQTGGLSLDLASGRIRSVAEDEGEHGWWRPPPPLPPRGGAGVGKEGRSGAATDGAAATAPVGSVPPGQR